MKIAIIGAGTAGLALASLLAPRHDVTVLEKTPEPSPVGAGVLLQPSGLQVLKAMGLFDELCKLGSPIEKLYGTLGGNIANGWPIMDMRYRAFAPTAFGLGLSRHALTSALLHRANSLGVRIQGASEITGLKPGQGLEGFDITVIANGAFSHLREAAGISAQVRPYPWGALWVLLRDPDQTVGPVLRQWYRGANQMLGLMPTGYHSLDDQRGQAPWISLFWSVRADRIEALRAQPLEAWKAQVLALSPAAKPFLDQIHHWDQLAWARYADVRCARPYAGKVICLGDAAHAMSPQLGQGSNMALIDATALAQCLEDEPSAKAFETYREVRRLHVATYQFFSKWLTPMFQADGWLMPTVRNLSFWPGSRLPGSSKLAAKLLTGYLFHSKDRHQN